MGGSALGVENPPPPEAERAGEGVLAGTWIGDGELQSTGPTTG